MEEAEAQESCPNIPPWPKEQHGEEPGDISQQLRHSEMLGKMGQEGLVDMIAW